MFAGVKISIMSLLVMATNNTIDFPLMKRTKLFILKFVPFHNEILVLSLMRNILFGYGTNTPWPIIMYLRLFIVSMRETHFNNLETFFSY